MSQSPLNLLVKKNWKKSISDREESLSIFLWKGEHRPGANTAFQKWGTPAPLCRINKQSRKQWPLCFAWLGDRWTKRQVAASIRRTHSRECIRLANASARPGLLHMYRVARNCVHSVSIITCGNDHSLQCSNKDDSFGKTEWKFT